MRKLVASVVLLLVYATCFGQEDSLLVKIEPIGTVSGNFANNYFIAYGYAGSHTNVNAKIAFVVDSSFSFNSASPSITTSVGDTLFWDVKGLNPYQSGGIFLSLTLDKKKKAGAIVTSKAFIYPASAGFTPYIMNDSLTQSVLDAYNGPADTPVPEKKGVQWVKQVEDDSIFSYGMSVIDTLKSGNIISAGGGQYNTNPASGVILQSTTKDGALLWRKIYTDFDVYSIKRMKVLDNGNIVLAGEAYKNLVSSGLSATYCWLQLYNDKGDKLWSKYIMVDTLGSARRYNNISNICVLPDGFMYVAGTSLSIDNGDSVTSWITKVDLNGNVIWTKHYSSNNEITSFNDVTASNDNELIATGEISSYQTRGILYKINAGTGNVIWSKDTLGNGADYSPASILKVSNGYIIAGTQTTANNAKIGLIRKVGFNGNSIWDQKLILDHNIEIVKLKQDENDNIVCLGKLGDQNGSIALLLLDTAGRLLAQQFVENDNISYLGFDVQCLGKNEYLLACRLQPETLNGQPLDIYSNIGAIIKLGYYNSVTGTVFIDVNKNNIKDVGERYADKILVESRKAGRVTGDNTQNGSFSNMVGNGIYSTKPVIPNSYYTINPIADTTYFSGWMVNDTVNFTLIPISNTNDLQIQIIPISPSRPGYLVRYKIKYTNVGTTTINNARIHLIKDKRQAYAPGYPIADSVKSDTLVWARNEILPLSEEEFEVELRNPAPPLLNVNDTLSLIATIYPVTDDATLADNTFLLKQVVKGSFDPNDKTEINNGVFTQSQVASKEHLQYMIRFQNTGTDTAFRIMVRDTLDNKLDWSTLEMVDASHAYTLQITNGNQLEWTFNDINLPDDKINEPASHGYIVYRIRPKTNVSVDDVIHNTAAIYFDFNLPVITNDAATEIQKDFTALPITLLSFDGKYDNQIVTLHWKTQNERNFNFFAVERSTDGIHFSIIAQKPSLKDYRGNEYEQLDEVKNIPAKMLYYRLRMVDLDGSINYSRIISIPLEDDVANAVKIYPNPVVHSSVTIAFYAQLDEAIEINIMDFSGRLISTQYRQVKKGNNTILINSFLKRPAGIYTIQLNINGKIRSYKVIVI